jgi:hypothetical protein
VNTETTRLHHPFSPSTLQYREVSPYWTPDNKGETDASLAGTAQHDATEDSIDIDNPKLADHEADAVKMCKEYRDALIASRPGCHVLKEVYLPIDNAKVTDDKGHEFVGTTGGYADLAIVSADKKSADVVDWKFGLWSVEPTENNLQGMAYLLGLVHLYPSLEEVTVHFCSPHRNEIDTHTFKREEFPALLLRVKTVVARAITATRADRDTSKCPPSVNTCLWCGNKGTCQALAGFAIKLGKKYSPLSIPDEVTPSLINNAQQATHTMELAQLMETWGKAVRAQITARVIEDENDVWMPAGYKLVEKSDRDIVDAKKVEEIARKEFGLSDAAIDAAKSIKLTPLNKAIADANKRGEKKEAQARFRDMLLSVGATKENPSIYFLERIKT